MNTGSMKSIAVFFPILAISLLGLAGGSFAAGSPSVDCDAGDSLQAKIDTAKPGFTIHVSGTCNERIRIVTDDLSLDGGGTWSGSTLVGGATIDGTGTNGTLVGISARRVTIRGFTIKNGARTNVSVGSSGSAVIQTNVIEDADSHGVVVNESSSAEIGGDGFGHVPDAGEGNIVRNNGSRGINVRMGGSARIFHNHILSNTADGVRMIDVGSGDIDGNLIDGNGGHGIQISYTSNARLSQNGSHGEANTLTNNDRSGVRCLRNSSLRGTAQVYGGNGEGPTNISGSCDSTLP